MKDRLRFYSKVSKPDKNGCMMWNGAKTMRGYGTLSWNKKSMTLAHRLSYELHKGLIPPGMCVCHSCDNPSCVNPEHLWLGSLIDNNQDMVNKNRHALKKGMRLYSKLTEDQVRDIRTQILNGITMVELSKKYNVSDRTINDINSGKLWASIDNEVDKKKRIEVVKKTRSRCASINNSKLSKENIIDIKKRLLLGESQRSIANIYDVSQFCIFEIKNERRWKHIVI